MALRIPSDLPVIPARKENSAGFLWVSFWPWPLGDAARWQVRNSDYDSESSESTPERGSADYNIRPNINLGPNSIFFPGLHRPLWEWRTGFATKVLQRSGQLGARS